MEDNIHRLDKTLPPYEFKTTYTGSETEKREIYKLRELSISPEASLVLGVLLNDIGGPRGYDSINNISIDHLIYELSSQIDTLNRDNLDLLEAYLIEMKTGMCTQGRSHRLRQFLFTIMD